MSNENTVNEFRGNQRRSIEVSRSISETFRSYGLGIK